MKTRILLFVFCLLVTSCTIVKLQAIDGVTPTAPTTVPTTAPTSANLPNPASAYCEGQGYTLEIRTAADSSQTGVCIFPDGSECNEWDYYRADCQPAPTLAPTSSPEFDSQGWKIYRNEQFGYSFHHPADAQISIDAEPNKSLSITGSGLGSEFWSIAHPSDRPEYRPPEDADLLQWLTDNYLVGENQQPDVQIAGVTAIHFRHERSQQAYADDRYYFAHGGQLYQILIGHTGETEDWELNNRFLLSFQFEEPLAVTDSPTPIPTAVPIDPSFYQGFWTYTHPVYGFSIMLPEDWAVDETTTFDPIMNDHTLILHPVPLRGNDLSIRMSFRNVGEEVLLWPTGVGEGEFISQGTLDIAGQPARRVYLVCPSGQIQSIWFQGGEDQANVLRSGMEFSFIYSYTGVYCQDGYPLTGKIQLVGELIIASLQVP